MRTVHDENESSRNTEKLIARIDALSPSDAIPVREYLETNGCLVSVNDAAVVSPHYHIVIGDVPFVKRILDKNIRPVTRPVALVWNCDTTTASQLARAFNAKIVLHKGGVLSSRILSVFFQFFFTGTSKLYDLDTNTELPLVKKSEEVVPTPIDTNIHGAARVPVIVPQPLFAKKRQDSAADSQRVKTLIGELFGDKNNTHKATGHPLSILKLKRSYVSERLLILSALFGVALSPFIFYGVFMIAAISSIQVAYNFLSRGQFEETRRISKYGEAFADAAHISIRFGTLPLTILGNLDTLATQEKLVTIVRESARSIELSARVVEKSTSVTTRLLSQITAGESPELQESQIPVLLSGIQNDLFLLIQRLGVVQAHLLALEAHPRGFVKIPFIAQKVTQAADKLGQVGETMRFIGNALSLYTKAGGFKEEKQYLLLFQNSMELRPTGGFIGSVGLVRVINGLVESIEIQDVYAIDGQLRGHVEPPPQIEAFLGQEHWYLRDSNWDPNFVASGEQARWFYEKETGVLVDGVIAINSPFVIDLLRVTGPIELPDYNDTISAGTFFEKSLQYTQANFFAGSTQKKDFLGTLSRALILRLFGEGNQSPELSTVIAQAFAKKNIQMYFADPDIESLAQYYRWAGSPDMTDRCEGRANPSQCSSDFIALSEANLGVNKANFYLTRKTSYQVSLSETGESEGRVAVEYSNASPGDTGGGGTYLGVVRLAVPRDSELVDIQFNGTPLSQAAYGGVVPTLPFQESVVESATTRTFTAVISVAPGAQGTLVYRYRRPTVIDPNARLFHYAISVPVQGGLINTTQSVVVSYPDHWVTTAHAAGQVNAKVIAKGGLVEYNTKVLEDIKLGLDFVK